MFLVVSLAQQLPKHVPDNPFSIPTYSYLNSVPPNRTAIQAIAAMGSIIPTQAVDLRSIGESPVGQVLRTTPLNSLSLAALTDPPDQANIYQGQTTSI